MRKLPRWAAPLLAGLGLALLAWGTIVAWSVIPGGGIPEALGVEAGRLAPCPDSPNCVSSRADPADAEHYLAPLRFAPEAVGTVCVVDAVMDAVEASPGAVVKTRRADYLHAEFRSRILRFVDDVEFHLDPDAGLLHFRSAARLGRSDLGVNRNRMQSLLADIAQRLAPR